MAGVLPWDSIVELVNTSLQIYQEQSSPQFQYKRKINALYKEIMSLETELDTIRNELKQALLKDDSDDVGMLTFKRQQTIDKLDKVQRDFADLWKLHDTMVPPEKVLDVNKYD